MFDVCSFLIFKYFNGLKYDNRKIIQMCYKLCLLMEKTFVLLLVLLISEIIKRQEKNASENVVC